MWLRGLLFESRNRFRMNVWAVQTSQFLRKKIVTGSLYVFTTVVHPCPKKIVASWIDLSKKCWYDINSCCGLSRAETWLILKNLSFNIKLIKFRVMNFHFILCSIWNWFGYIKLKTNLLVSCKLSVSAMFQKEFSRMFIRAVLIQGHFEFPLWRDIICQLQWLPSLPSLPLSVCNRP